MGELSSFGKILIFAGIVMVVVGGFLVFGNRIPYLGKLPGDITVQKKNFSFYVPVTTCIIISIIITLIMRFFGNK